MIIDSHVHIASPPLNQEYIKCKISDGSFITLPFKRENCSVEHLLNAMDTYNIDMACVNAFSGAITNQDLSHVLKKYQSKFIGFAWIENPLEENMAVEELDNAINSLGFKGLKLHPGVQGFNPANPKLFPLIKKAADLRIPIFIHMFPWPLGTFHYYRPENIAILKKNVPDAHILIGHMVPQHFMELEVLLWEPGLYVETSFGLETITNLYGVDFAERWLRRIGINNVVFGSDWMGTQDGDTRIADNNLKIFNQMNLTQDEKNKILGENIQEILNLD
ncbi:MAG: amidohydrolase family protein [Candidatus Hodarchaeales archaeon]|jgi:predicted TIM-barrel fold metal-dependent hydrolase